MEKIEIKKAALVEDEKGKKLCLIATCML